MKQEATTGKGKTMKTITNNQNQAGLDAAYQSNLGGALSALGEIEKMLLALPLSDRNWGHVGDLNHVALNLKVIRDEMRDWKSAR